MNFSSRFPSETSPNPIARLLEEKHHRGIPIVDLTHSNPTEAGFEYAMTEVMSAFQNQGMLSYAPHPRGLSTARASIAAYYGRRGRAPDIDRIHLTASTSEAYSFLLKLLANPGDEILVASPSYPLIEHLAGLESVLVRPFRLRYHEQSGWRIDRATLEDQCGTRTRAVCVVNPNNPTGSYLHDEDMEYLAAFCSRNELALICDEVFYDYPIQPDVNRVSTAGTDTQCLTFTLNGFSKLLALPQMKLGWIVTDGPRELVHPALDRLDFIADAYLSVGTPVQLAAERLFTTAARMQETVRARLILNAKALRERFAVGQGLNARRIEPLPVHGGWCGVLRVPSVQDELAFVLGLLDRGNVLVHPGYFFDFEAVGYFVVSLLTECDAFRRGIDALAGALEEKHLSIEPS